MDSEWRKIDIDALDPDRLGEGPLVEPFGLSAEEANAAAQERQRNVRGHLSRGDTDAALTEALEGQPWGEDMETAKQTSLGALLLVLAQTPTQQIAQTLAALTSEQQDTLMKYLYAAMDHLSANTNTNSSTLGTVLGWHEKLTESAGIGCIVRVMSDRRRV